MHSKDRERETHRTGRMYPSGGRLYKRKRWLIARRRQLFDQPLCAECGEMATDVDHIISLEQGGEPWAPENLASMCHACHSAKTRREQHA